MSSRRKIVPLVTPDFDWAELDANLPSELASHFRAANAVKVDHDYFDASMVTLRTRFLIPVASATAVEPLAEHTRRAMAAQPPIDTTLLRAQKHLERAFASARLSPDVTMHELDLASGLFEKSVNATALLKDYDEAHAQVQSLLRVQMAMQRENQLLTSVSNVLKTRHDTAKNSIANIR